MTRRKFILLLGCTACFSTGSTFFGQSRVKHIPVLMYHDLSTDIKDEYTLFPSEFYAQMEYLYQMGYRSVFPEEVGHRETSDEKLFILTFDDGYASFIEYAFPLLSLYGFKSIINIVGSSVGRYIDLRGNRPTLSWDEYRFLLATGLIRVGYHGYHIHRINWYRSTSPEELKKDALIFIERLKKELGVTTDIFAAPYGQYTQEHLDVLKNLGFKHFLTSEEGFYKPGDKTIRRLAINPRIDLESFKQYVGGL